MRTLLLILGLVALTSFVSMAGCSECNGWSSSTRYWVERTDTMTLDTSGIDTLKSQIHNGSIEVTAREDGQSQIQLVAVLHGGGNSEEDAQKCLDTMVIKTERIGSTQSICQDWNGLYSQHWQTKVHMELKVPEQIKAELKTHNGDIQVQRMKSDCRLQSHNGTVTLNGGGSDVYVKVHNGGIRIDTPASRVEMHSHNGTINSSLRCDGDIQATITTHNGSVNLALADTVTGELKCTTHNGSIRSSLKADNLDIRSNKSLVARLQSDPSNGLITARTHNGSITINPLQGEQVTLY